MWGDLGKKGNLPFEKNKKGSVSNKEKVSDDVLIKKGEGTPENPWRVRGTKIWKDKDGKVHRESY